MAKPKTYKAFVCDTTLDFEVGQTEITLYPSVKALKKDRACWRDCGISEVEIKRTRLVKKGKP